MDTPKSISRFIGRCLIAAIPLLLLLGAYILLDPFKVVYDTNPAMPPNGTILPFNKGLISLRAYENERNIRHYNAFIFGSSRTIYYRASDWACHLPSDASIIHMDASSETTEGILLKLRYIESVGDSIQYALIEFAPWAFSTKKEDIIPYRIPHQLTDSPAIIFHWKYFHDFLQRDFIKTYAMYLLTGDPIERSDHRIFSFCGFNYDIATNECINDSIESLISAAPQRYFPSRFTPDEFAAEFARDSVPPTLSPAIDSLQKSMLTEMRQIFDRNHTDYRIIIGPDWQRDNIAPEDLNILTETFGHDHVYNLSQWHQITDSQHNFYDHTHYRPHIAKAIIDSIYRK